MLKVLKVKAVPFDVDGTLIDSIDDYYLSLTQAMNKYCLPLPRKDRVVELLNEGTPLRETLDRILPIEVHERESLINLSFQEVKRAYEEYSKHAA